MASTGGNSAVSGSSTSPSSNVPVATVPKPREKIPGYIFGDVIGTGAYAKVRRCYSEKFKSNVAVKIVSKKNAPKDYLTKFLPREIQCIHKLRHKHIVRMLEVLETERSMYIVMQEAENGDLLDFINANHRKIAEKDAKVYFKEILEAVEHCHTKNVVHRDLKCENILFDKDMVIKLSDFGFARTINPEVCLLKTHCGSLAYAAPEIVKGKDYDGRISDVWSLGVVLFAMVNGKLPFNDTSVKNLLAAINKGISFQSRVSEACRNVITMMLVTDTTKRVTIKELLQNPWFHQEAGQAFTCASPSPRESVEVARDDANQFLHTPRQSPAISPANSPGTSPGTSPRGSGTDNNLSNDNGSGPSKTSTEESEDFSSVVDKSTSL